MADIGDVKVRFLADTQGFVTGVGTARTAVQNFQQTAETATGPLARVATGFERFERREPYLAVRNLITAFDMFAATSIGLEGPMGRIATSLLMLGTGGVVGVAVTAGLAAIALGMKFFTEQTDFAATSIKNLHEAVKKLAADLPETKMANLRAEFAMVSRQMAELAPKVEAAKKHLGEMTTLFGPHNAATERAAKHYQDLATQLERMQAVLETLKEPGMLPAITVETSERRRLGPVAGAGDLTTGSLVPGIGIRDPRNPLLGGHPFTFDSAGLALADAMPGPMKNAVDKTGEIFKERMKRLGMDAIRSLIDGIFQGTVNFGDILKNLIEEFVLAKIEGPLKKILGIASPSTVGMEIGGYLAQGIGLGLTTANLGPMKLNLNVNTGSMPAPLTPFEAARDRSWQTLLRESQLVSQSQGFRLRGS